MKGPLKAQHTMGSTPAVPEPATTVAETKRETKVKPPKSITEHGHGKAFPGKVRANGKMASDKDMGTTHNDGHHPNAHPGEGWNDHKMTSRHTSKSIKSGRFS